MKVELLVIVGNDGLFWSIECKSFSLCTRTQLGDVVKSKNHIL